MSPGFDWDTYFAASGYPRLEAIAVGQPEFYEGLSALLRKTGPEVLRSVLVLVLLHPLPMGASEEEADHRVVEAAVHELRDDGPEGGLAADALEVGHAPL